jgi:hypothetical protein
MVYNSCLGVSYNLEGNVRKLNTHYGSREGGTMLRIYGQGEELPGLSFIACRLDRALRFMSAFPAHSLKTFFMSVGFSGDQFAFDDPTLGNVVTLHGNDGVKIPCAVVETDTSSTKISCEVG